MKALLALFVALLLAGRLPAGELEIELALAARFEAAGLPAGEDRMPLRELTGSPSKGGSNFGSAAAIYRLLLDKLQLNRLADLTPEAKSTLLRRAGWFFYKSSRSAPSDTQESKLYGRRLVHLAVAENPKDALALYCSAAVTLDELEARKKPPSAEREKRFRNVLQKLTSARRLQPRFPEASLLMVKCYGALGDLENLEKCSRQHEADAEMFSPELYFFDLGYPPRHVTIGLLDGSDMQRIERKPPAGAALPFASDVPVPSFLPPTPPKRP